MIISLQRPAQGKKAGISRQTSTTNPLNAEELFLSSRALQMQSLGADTSLRGLDIFCIDRDSSGSDPVFNRVVTLKDTWAKVEKAITKGKTNK